MGRKNKGGAGKGVSTPFTGNKKTRSKKSGTPLSQDSRTVLTNQDMPSINPVQAQVSTTENKPSDLMDAYNIPLSPEAGKTPISLFGIGGHAVTTKNQGGGNRAKPIVPGATEDRGGGNRAEPIVPGANQDNTKNSKEGETTVQFFGTDNKDTSTSNPEPEAKDDGTRSAASRNVRGDDEEQGDPNPSLQRHDVAITPGERDDVTSPSAAHHLLNEQAHHQRDQTHGRWGDENRESTEGESIEGRRNNPKSITTSEESASTTSGQSQGTSNSSNNANHGDRTTATGSALYKQLLQQGTQEEEVVFVQDNGTENPSISVTYNEMDYAPSDIMSELQAIGQQENDEGRRNAIYRVCNQIARAADEYEASLNGPLIMDNSFQESQLTTQVTKALNILKRYKDSSTTKADRQEDGNDQGSLASSSSGPPSDEGQNNREQDDTPPGGKRHGVDSAESNPQKPPRYGTPQGIPDFDDSCVDFLVDSMMEHITYLYQEDESFLVSFGRNDFKTLYQKSEMDTWKKIGSAAYEYRDALTRGDDGYISNFRKKMVDCLHDRLGSTIMYPYEMLCNLQVAYIASLLPIAVGKLYRDIYNDAIRYPDTPDSRLQEYQVRKDKDLVEHTDNQTQLVLTGEKELEKIRDMIENNHDEQTIQRVHGYIPVLHRYGLDTKWIHEGVQRMYEREVSQIFDDQSPNRDKKPPPTPRTLNLPTGKAPDVTFPTLVPPNEDLRQSHLTGRYERSGEHKKARVVWKGYDQPIEFNQLPRNLAYTLTDTHCKAHWGDRIIRGGTIKISADGKELKDNSFPNRANSRGAAQNVPKQNVPKPKPRTPLRYVPGQLRFSSDGVDISDIQHQDSNSPDKSSSGRTKVTFGTTTFYGEQHNTSGHGIGTVNQDDATMGSNQVPLTVNTHTDKSNPDEDDLQWGDPGTTPINHGGYTPPNSSWKYPTPSNNTGGNMFTSSGSSQNSQQAPPYNPYGGGQTPIPQPNFAWGYTPSSSGGSSGPPPSGGGGPGRQGPPPSGGGGFGGQGPTPPPGGGGPTPPPGGGGPTPPPGGGGFGGQGPTPPPGGGGFGGFPPFGPGSGGFGHGWQGPTPPPGSGAPSPSGYPYSQPPPMYQSKTSKPIVKPDMRSYPKLKTIQDFDSWYKDSRAMARAHGIEEIFEAKWRPDTNNMEAILIFGYKQSFMYATLRIVIKPIELRQFVDKYEPTSDAQQVIAEMTYYVRNSAHAFITTRNMMTQITTTKLSLKSWNKPTYEFIIKLDDLFQLYNRQQRYKELRITPAMMRLYMENALSDVRAFREIKDREQERIIMGQGPFSYDQYKVAVKSTASRLDETYMSKNRRDINVHLLENDDDENNDNISMEYLIHEAKRHFRSPDQLAAQMNKDTWNSLSSDAQKTWDELDKEDKAKILNYAQKREERRSAKVHQIEDSRETKVNFHESITEETDKEEEEPLGSHIPSIDVNNALVDARNDAHIGDPRKIMGSDQSPAKNKIKASMHRLVNDDGNDSQSSSDEYNGYWDDQDFCQGYR